MKKMFFAVLISALANCVSASVPTITDVTCSQGNTLKLTVSYTLANGPAYVTLDVTTNGVSVGGKSLASVVGEVNAKLESGSHQFVWNLRNAGLESRDFNPNEVKVVLNAHALSDAPEYMLLDLTTGTLGYYESAALMPNGPLLESGTISELLADPYRTTKIVFRKIPAAGVPFQIGTSGDQNAYRALLSYDYYISVYEVTQSQMTRWNGDGSSHFVSLEESPVLPVDLINSGVGLRGETWPGGGHDDVDANTPIGKLRTLAGGVKFDLPTLAEWEFAARRETVGDWDFGKTNDLVRLDDSAWNTNNSGMVTHPVGLKRPNVFGLYDMYGNVTEWILDRNANNGIASVDTTRLAVDPVGSSTVNSRCRMGGSYRTDATDCNCHSVRGGNWDNYMFHSGFRLCLPACEPSSATTGDADASQDSATRVVTVRYHLDEAAVVTLDVLTNGVSIGQENITHAWGDVNRLVEAGDGEIKWAAGASWPGHGELGDFTVKVVKWPLNSPPDYVVTGVGPSTGTVRLYYTCPEQIPFGITNAIYKSELFVMHRVHAAGRVWAMGSPETESGRTHAWEILHMVSLSADYYLGVYEVTQRQYQRALGLADDKMYGYECHYKTTPDWELLPMNSNSQWTASTALRGSTDWPAGGHAVGNKSPLASWRARIGLEVDLPTEAQWEYAARAGEYAIWPCGDDSAALGDHAWYKDNSDGRPHEVGLKLPNGFGFYDMIGNVSEYCLQYLNKNGDYYGLTDDELKGVAIDPVGSSSGNLTRISRGGSFAATTSEARLAARGTGNDGSRQVGFRLCAPAIAR